VKLFKLPTKSKAKPQDTEANGQVEMTVPAVSDDPNNFDYFGYKIPRPQKPPFDYPIDTPEEQQMDPASIIAPDQMEVNFDYVKVNDIYFRTLYVSGYPRFVSPGWLNPIINFDHSLDISFFIYPVEGQEILSELRRKITEMEAELSTDIQRGKIVNPGTEAKLEDAKALQDMLIKGAERFYQFSFYITIPAISEEELNSVTKRVESTLGSILISAKHAALDMEKAFISAAPFGRDSLLVSRNMDTTSLATTFPFTTAELSSDRGVLYGINSQNDSFIIFDRFELENSNMAVFATSGAGKTVMADESVLFDKGDGPEIGKIGSLVENQIKNNNLVRLDEESEGVINPNLKVFTFDNDLKGKWTSVEIAARKLSPKDLYKITTRSGREITTTGDHNFVVLQNGKLEVTKGKKIKKGQHVPVPRQVYTSTSGLETKHSSKEFLTLLGLITSEGHIRNEFVTFSNTEPQILLLAKTCIESSGFKAAEIKDSNKNTKGYYLRPAPLAVALMKKLGAGGLSGDKRVPPHIFSLSNEQTACYLKAYYEGDGGVENHEITATTKSKELASDLSYLLLRFGIIARIKTRRKAATNTSTKLKRTYYRVSISGQDNMRKFIKQIGFITDRKNRLANKLLKEGNTNIDVVPEIGNVFKEIYPVLYNSENPAPKKFSEIKLGVFQPSPRELLKIVAKIEERIAEIEFLETDGISTLQKLPEVSDILKRAKNKKVNSSLWSELGATWPSVRNERKSYLETTLKAVSVTHNVEYSRETVSGAVYRSFKNTGESLRFYDKSLWESVVLGNKNPEYGRVIDARDYIFTKYKKKKRELREIKKKIEWLKTLAKSELFWDPIVSVKKIKAKYKYVYDLQVGNQVFLAGHGGMFVHNSFFVKLESVRSLMLGTEVLVIDPENEYKALAEAAGGEYIVFSASSSSKINPFDLSQVYVEGEDQLGLKILTLHSLFKIVMGDINATQEALLDRALINAYRAKGITQDPETQKREPPLIEDLYKALIGMETEDALDLAARIEKFVKGSYVGVFDQQTNIDIRNPYTVFSVRDVEDAVRPIVMFIILDFIWTKVRRDIKRRLLIVDEAWHMMKYQDSAQFMWSIAKRARKYYLGLTTITQDVEDFLNHDIGKAVVTNAAMRLLLKQSPAAIDKISEVFYLSQGERQLLLAADVGEGILFAGPHHAPIKVVASPEEYEFVTTKPQDVMDQKQASEASAKMK
jgi:intein/homing endonuclease